MALKRATDAQPLTKKFLVNGGSCVNGGSNPELPTCLLSAHNVYNRQLKEVASACLSTRPLRIWPGLLCWMIRNDVVSASQRISISVHTHCHAYNDSGLGARCDNTLLFFWRQDAHATWARTVASQEKKKQTHQTILSRIRTYSMHDV